ncbi:MAG: hypothetical protein GC162_16640 [Planctomycetes bacterium]|nr:hypothetical protein [Planctomycetota bacterium]
MRESIHDIPLDELACRYLEGEGGAEAAAALSERLRDDATARGNVLALSRMCVLLTEIMSDDRTARGTCSFAPPAPRTSTFRRQAAAWLAVAAVIVIAVGLHLAMRVVPVRVTNEKPARSLAMLTDAKEATFASTMVEPALGGAIGAGDVSLRSGSAQIMFMSGAVVDLTGPCELNVIDVNHAALLRGSLSAFVRAEARGFTVDLPGGVRLVDLGTRFDAQVSETGAADVIVRQGRVRVVSADGSIELEAGGMAHVAAGRVTFEPFAAPLPRTDNKSRVLDHLPARITASNLVDDEHILVIPERADVTLTRPLPVDLPANAKLPAGTHVRSYLVYKATTTDVALASTLHFDAPIVGILCQEESLAATDAVLGLPSVEYVDAKNRGCELDSDQVKISADRRTLTLRLFSVAASTDQLRVLVAADTASTPTPSNEKVRP